MARLTDGFSTTITLSNIPSTKLYEQEIAPPGIEGGGAIDVTTMRNTAWRTFAAKVLKTLAPFQLTVAYDTAAIADVINQVNVNQSIVVTFPDGHTLTFWGYLNSFKPNAMKEGTEPLAAVEIIPTLLNSSNQETAPVYV